MSAGQSQSLAFKVHDHEVCSTQALETAEEYCDKYQLKLTPVRRKVLEILLKEHRAIGAYAILDFLKELGFRSQPTVCLLYTSPSPRDRQKSRMPSSA